MSETCPICGYDGGFISISYGETLTINSGSVMICTEKPEDTIDSITGDVFVHQETDDMTISDNNRIIIEAEPDEQIKITTEGAATVKLGDQL